MNFQRGLIKVNHSLDLNTLIISYTQLENYFSLESIVTCVINKHDFPTQFYVADEI